MQDSQTVPILHAPKHKWQCALLAISADCMSSAGNAGPLVHNALVQVVANPKGECSAACLTQKRLQVWDRPWWARPVHRSQRFNSSLAPLHL